MTIEFLKKDEGWVAEFEATADFNLHLEGVVEGNVNIYQRTTASGGYTLVRGATPYPSYSNVYDYDFTALVYPKFIKVVCPVQPSYAEVMSTGEVTELKYQSKAVEITENGTTSITPDAGFAALNAVSVKVNVPTSGEGGGSTSSSKWTGHADAEGLKAIGWTDEDIAYYQEHGVNWNAEDDEYHKVSDDNKALYGVLTADNISTYKDRIVYLPKIDTSGMKSMSYMFNGCYSLVSIPQLDTQNVTDMGSMFYNCHSLVSIPQLDTANVTDIGNMFYKCYALVSIPQLNTAKVRSMVSMFSNCYSLVSIPQLDTANVTSMDYMFYYCHSLISIPQLDTANVTSVGSMFSYCYSLTYANIKKAKVAYNMSNARLLSKESLLYLINNEAATSAITIKLASYAYTRLANDADIVAALANHPNISISQ